MWRDVATVATGVAIGAVAASIIDAVVLVWLFGKLRRWWETL